MLTIEEIKDISFRRGRGYRGEDVDAFIDEVIVSFEQLKKEKSDLIRKMDILATRVEQYRADEETVRNALLSSQRVADA
jgi:cell division initiation protein